MLVFVCFSANLNKFLRMELPSPCRLSKNIKGGNCILTDRPETTLNIIVSCATFLLFSSVGYFKSFRVFVTVPGVVLHIFIFNKTNRSSLHTVLVFNWRFRA